MNIFKRSLFSLVFVGLAASGVLGVPTLSAMNSTTLKPKVSKVPATIPQIFLLLSYVSEENPHSGKSFWLPGELCDQIKADVLALSADAITRLRAYKDRSSRALGEEWLSNVLNDHIELIKDKEILELILAIVPDRSKFILGSPNFAASYLHHIADSGITIQNDNVVQIAKLITSIGGQTLSEVRDTAGRTALHYAASIAQDDVVFQILANADDAYALIVMQDRFNNTPLHTAAWQASVRLVHIPELAERYINIIKLLIAFSADQAGILLSMEDHGDRTALDIAKKIAKEELASPDQDSALSEQKNVHQWELVRVLKEAEKTAKKATKANKKQERLERKQDHSKEKENCVLQ